MPSSQLQELDFNFLLELHQNKNVMSCVCVLQQQEDGKYGILKEEQNEKKQRQDLTFGEDQREVSTVWIREV